MRQLILHIGINKTGTSAIQRFLRTRRKQLLQLGTLYPTTGLAVNAHHPIAQALGARKDQVRASSVELASLQKSLLRELDDSGCNTMLISSEDFTLIKDTGIVREFFRDMDVRIVVYLRRHDYWWISAYNQAVKMVVNPTWPRGVEAYVRHCRKTSPMLGNYRVLLECWDEVFGQQSICVRPYEKQQNPHGVVADFMQAIELSDMAGEALEDARLVNISLDRETLILMELLQRANISTEMRQRVHKRLLARPRPNESLDIMAPAMKRQLIDEHRADYQYIARKYLGREEGALFLEPEPSGQEPWQDPLRFTQVELTSTLLNLLEE